MSYTYVILQVSRAAYDEIKAKLEEASYGHAFHEDTEGPLIDMQRYRPPSRGADRAMMNEARRRAVAYLRVLRDNHPHLRDAYEHATINLEAALQTEWQPLHHEIKP